MIYFFISGFKIPHGSVSISRRQLGNLPSFMTWSTIAHEYELPVPEKNLFYWPIHCFVMVLVRIAFDEIGHLLGCSIRPNLVLIRPWLFRKVSSRYRSTCCVQISWNLADGKSVKSCVAYLTKTNKISPGSLLSLLGGSRQKSARVSPDNVLRVLQISSSSVHFRRSYNPTREHRQNAP